MVKSCGAIQDAEEFLEVIQPQTQKITLIKTTPAEVKRCEEIVASWNSPKVVTIGKQHQATVHEDRLFLRPTSCYGECCMQEDLTPTCSPWKKATSSAQKPRARLSNTPAPPPVPESDSEDELEDVVGANEPGVMEEVFSSDDDTEDVDAADLAHRAMRAVDRRKRREVRHSHSAKAAAVLAQSSSESDSDSDDPDYVPEPEVAARHATIAQARRRGQIINEVADDLGIYSSSDDWAVAETCLSVTAYKRKGF